MFIMCQTCHMKIYHELYNQQLHPCIYSCSSGGVNVNKGHVITYIFKKDEIILYNDQK